MSNATGPTLGHINDTFQEKLGTQETDLREMISRLATNAGGEISNTDLLVMQYKQNSFNLTIQLQSSLMKSLNDSMTEVVRRF